MLMKMAGLGVGTVDLRNVLYVEARLERAMWVEVLE